MNKVNIFNGLSILCTTCLPLRWNRIKHDLFSILSLLQFHIITYKCKHNSFEGLLNGKRYNKPIVHWMNEWMNDAHYDSKITCAHLHMMHTVCVICIAYCMLSAFCIYLHLFYLTWLFSIAFLYSSLYLILSLLTKKDGVCTAHN